MTMLCSVGTVCVAPPPGQGDLPQREDVGLRGGRRETQGLLPEPVSHGQALPGEQDTLLRGRAIPLLHHD
jgi:hypothetical protein